VEGIDFNKVEKSDFKVLSESFKPRMSGQQLSSFQLCAL
jgi:hypothetical protein